MQNPSSQGGSPALFGAIAEIHLIYDHGSNGSTVERDLDIEVATGTELHLLSQAITAYDPIEHLAWRDDTDQFNPATKPNVSVYDVDTDRVLLHLSDSDAARLKVSALAIYAGRLYAQTTDGTPEIDLSTGKTISDNAAAYPVGPVGDLTFWSDGVLSEARERD